MSTQNLKEKVREITKEMFEIASLIKDTQQGSKQLERLDNLLWKIIDSLIDQAYEEGFVSGIKAESELKKRNSKLTPKKYKKSSHVGWIRKEVLRNRKNE